jgi:hypothetical protein
VLEQYLVFVLQYFLKKKSIVTIRCFVDWTFEEKNTESSAESLNVNEAKEYVAFAYFLWNCQDRFLHIVLDDFEGNLQSLAV